MAEPTRMATMEDYQKIRDEQLSMIKHMSLEIEDLRVENMRLQSAIKRAEQTLNIKAAEIVRLQTTITRLMKMVAATNE
jgi:hypothetical protein